MKSKFLIGLALVLLLVFSGMLGKGGFFGVKTAFGYGGNPPDKCTLPVTPPAGGFSVISLTGNEVTNPNIVLGLDGGDASYAMISNFSNFSNYAVVPYSQAVNWTFTSGYGYKTVYVRYLNSCSELPSITVSVTVNYVVDQCTLPVTPPVGGFKVVSLSGSEVTSPYIQLGLSGGSAAYAEVSNYSDFSSYAFVPYTSSLAWTLTSGYGSKTVYVRYFNSCKTLPSAVVTVTVNYVNGQCSLPVTPPAGGFSVASLSGTTVTNPNIQLGLSGGNAAYMEVSNNSDFSNSSTYAYAANLNWQIAPAFGAETVYVRYLNACDTLPSATVSVTVNYIDYCSIPVTPPTAGFSVTSLSGSTVTNPIIGLGINGGNAAYMDISNYSNFANYTTYAYATTIGWTLTPGYGAKTVYVRFANSCNKAKTTPVNVTVNYVDYCTIGATPPTGGFSVASVNGATVYTQTIPLALAGGNASYVDVSNSANFSTYSEYAYSPTLNWTLTPGYGSKTVYVRYLNSCKAAPSATVGVTVNYTIDPCTIGVTPPAGGFSVTSQSGSTVYNPGIVLGLSGGNAAYMEVSNNFNFANSTVYPYATTLNWTLSSGFGGKTVYVRYMNSCKALPSATVSVTVNYVDECTLNVTPPVGGFSVTSLSGSSVIDPAIQLGLKGGNAAYVDVSNSLNFATYSEFAYSPTLNWTLSSGFGSKTVYVRYLNSCKALPSRIVSVTVTYVNVCTIGLTPPQNGFMVVSNGTVNVHTPNVSLGMYGGNAAYMEVSNNSDFSNSTWYPYASTLPWTLSSGYGNKTVWVKYYNSCKAEPSIGVSVSFTYTKK
jgi:hypothetical protein